MSLPKNYKMSLGIVYECYINQAELLGLILDDHKDEYEDLFTDPIDEQMDILEYNSEIADMHTDKEIKIAELSKLHANMLDNAEELSAHLIGGRIKTKETT